MELRETFATVAIVALAALAQGCTDACDEYASSLEEKLTACGIEVPVPEDDAEEAPEPSCTDARWVQAECLEACLPEGCGALDGSDAKAATAYGECRDSCPVAGL